MSHETVSPYIILASSSPYRATLLERLRIPFSVQSPEIDERPLAREAPHDLVRRLAVQKAMAIAEANRQAVVIGSDQLAFHGEEIIGKPQSAKAASRQLEAFSGETVQFLTSVAVVGVDKAVVGQAVVETRVAFRRLDRKEIERYLEADQPFDCAGSFKAESLGPSLFESMFSQDPTAIIGLPLIETARLLRMAGFKVP
jgi:septum formation protein